MVVDPHTNPGGHLPEQGTTSTEQCGKCARTDPQETRLQIIIESFHLQIITDLLRVRLGLRFHK